MTHCKVISGTYFDEDNGEYQSYGIVVDNGTEKIVVEDISVVREEVEEDCAKWIIRLPCRRLYRRLV